MLGYDISWAAFNIIEVMSSTKFTFKVSFIFFHCFMNQILIITLIKKRIGYLAASQSFHEGTDVVMLTTNMIRKDLCSQSMYETGIALSGLSCFITPDLARDLANEILTLVNQKSMLIMKII